MKNNSVNPLVSIIIPTYNHQKYVKQSILSAINQVYDNIEIIIIDDGSTDDTREICRSIVDEYKDEISITYIEQENKGLTRTLNYGINISKGVYVQFLASDDAYLPNKTSVCVNSLINSHDSIFGVYSDGYLINDSGDKISRFSDKYIKPIGVDYYKEIIVGNWLPALGILYKKSHLIDVGCFDSNVKVEDYDLYMRLFGRYSILWVPDKLFLYRWHEANFSKNQEVMNKEFQIIYEKYEDLSKFHKFCDAVKNKSVVNLIKFSSLLNIDLFCRKIIRLFQIKYNIQNVGYFSAANIIAKRGLKLAFAILKAKFTNALVLNVGNGSKLYGSVRLTGRRSAVSFGDKCSILGELKIIVPYGSINSTVEVGDNVIIDNNVIMHSMGGKIYIGSNCYIGPNVLIQANGDVFIGDYTMIASNSAIYANSHSTLISDTPFCRQNDIFEGVDIGRNCWIGSGVIVLDGGSVGENSVVAAGCVVKGEYKSGAFLIAKGLKANDFSDVSASLS